MYSHRQRAQELADKINALEDAYALHPSRSIQAQLKRLYNELTEVLQVATGRKFDLGTSAAYRGLDPARIASVA